MVMRHKRVTKQSPLTLLGIEQRIVANPSQFSKELFIHFYISFK